MTARDANSDALIRSLRPNDLAVVPVPGISDAVDLAVGAKHTCVLRANGEVWCWGNNNHGQLGDGTTTRRFDPVPVIGLGAPDGGAGR